MLQRTANPYDEVPYQGQVIADSHPNQLATIGTLFGMQTAPLDQCRVLEMGCAEGCNLIPMASGLPSSRFVGIDLSERQIEIGRGVVRRLGLKNVELLQRDIRSLDESLGRFDYIILHGVYSWVPDDVRDKILEYCRRQLNPHGIAYISYTTYPGGHIREMVRDMMFYHIRRETDPRKRIAASRGLLDLLVEANPEQQSAYGAALKWEWNNISKTQDHHVRHDSLSEVMEPCYFYQFIDRARTHGLQYLGDATLQTMQPNGLPLEVVQTLRQFSQNLVEFEQYMDFVRNRTFRKTLLCQQEICLNHHVGPSVVGSYHVSSPMQSDAAGAELHSDDQVRFRHPRGGEVTVRTPFTKMAFHLLSKTWPRNLAFDALVRETRSRLSEQGMVTEPAAASADGTGDLAGGLLECFSRGLVRFDLQPVGCASVAGPHPVATPIARLQAEHGDSVTNLRHEAVHVDPFVRLLLPNLDGSRDRDALLRSLQQHSNDGTLVVKQPDGEPVHDPEQLRTELSCRINKALDGLAKSALLLE